nr:MAG TPA: hypothetical protein [Caudoviricetes sp.]
MYGREEYRRKNMQTILFFILIIYFYKKIRRMDKDK